MDEEGRIHELEAVPPMPGLEPQVDTVGEISSHVRALAAPVRTRAIRRNLVVVAILALSTIVASAIALTQHVSLSARGSSLASARSSLAEARSQLNDERELTANLSEVLNGVRDDLDVTQGTLEEARTCIGGIFRVGMAMSGGTRVPASRSIEIVRLCARFLPGM